MADTNNRERFKEAKQELDKVLADYETNAIPLIFCYHKIDLPGSLDHIIEARGMFKQRLANRQGRARTK